MRYLACALFAILAMAFPGGGSGAAAHGGTTTLASDYSSRLEHHLSWRMFPLSVYFTHDANYSPEMERLARAGFDRWTSASGDLVRYQVVNSSTKANVTVRFDPGTDNGLTHTAFYGSRIVHAEINVGVRDGDETDVEAIAAHEFGHALGIDGHSDNPRDLMYPVHYRGTEGIITARDLNTLATEYPAIVHAVGEDAPPVQARRGSGQPKA